MRGQALRAKVGKAETRANESDTSRHDGDRFDVPEYGSLKSMRFYLNGYSASKTDMIFEKKRRKVRHF